MLTYSLNGSQSALFSSVSLIILGDGTTTDITIDLGLPPLNLDLKGNKPVALGSSSVPGGTATLQSNGTKVDIHFSSAPAANSQTGISFTPVYPGA